MKNHLFAFFMVLLCSLATLELCAKSSNSLQTINLKGSFNQQSASIRLNWNMVKTSYRTGYILLKSSDGKSWYEALQDKTLRDYSEKDIYNFDDKLFAPNSKNYYRIRIFDAENNTVAISPIVIITPNASSAISTSINETYSKWNIFPNPVFDVLNLSCKENEQIKGVINVRVTDVTGKVVKQFRAASTNRSLTIPISNLRKGMYAVQISIQDELVLSDKFIKQ
jgi:hypothetical protein